MRRLSLILVLIAVICVPAGSTLAQEPSGIPELPYYCQFDYVVNELMFRLENVTTLEDLGQIFQFLVDMATSCAEPILNMIMEELGLPPVNGGGDVIFQGFDPNDGVMTGNEAEFVIQTAFSGDIAGANLYICPSEQLDPADLEEIEQITVNHVDCAEGPDNTIVCEYSAQVELAGSYPETFETTFTFHVEDGKLCETE